MLACDWCQNMVEVLFMPGRQNVLIYFLYMLLGNAKGSSLIGKRQFIRAISFATSFCPPRRCFFRREHVFRCPFTSILYSWWWATRDQNYLKMEYPGRRSIGHRVKWVTAHIGLRGRGWPSRRPAHRSPGSARGKREAVHRLEWLEEGW